MSITPQLSIVFVEKRCHPDISRLSQGFAPNLDNFAHVDSNREFSRKLDDLGVPHEAEEYAGTTFEKTWLDDGRFYTRL